MIDYGYEERLVDRIAVNEAIAARLNPRQRYVLLRYTRYGETYREIARSEGLSVERIRQHHVRALDKLRKPLVAEPPRPTTRNTPLVGFDKAAFLRHMRLLIELREQHAIWERQAEVERREREERHRRQVELYELETARLRKQNEFARERAELARLIARETAKNAPPPPPTISLPVQYTVHKADHSVYYVTPSYHPPPLPTKDELCAKAHEALRYLLLCRPQQFAGTPWLGKWCTSVVFTRDGGEVSEAVNSIVRELPPHARLSAYPVPIETDTPGAHATTPYASLRVTLTPDGMKLRFDVTWD